MFLLISFYQIQIQIKQQQQQQQQKLIMMKRSHNRHFDVGGVVVVVVGVDVIAGYQEKHIQGDRLGVVSSSTRRRFFL